MKKVFYLLLLFLSISIVKAAELQNLDLIWENTSVGEVSLVREAEDGYFVYGSTGIFRFYNNISGDYKKYLIENSYDYKIEDDIIKLYRYNGYTYSFETINKELELQNSIDLNLADINYYKELEDGYFFIGYSDHKLYYYKLNKNLKIIDSKSIDVSNETHLGKVDYNTNTYYFYTSFTSSYYKFDGEFSEISKAVYDNSPGSKENFSLFFATTNTNYDYNYGISEELYNRIKNREQPQHQYTEMNAQVIQDKDNYVVLYQEQQYYWGKNENITNFGFKLVYLDNNLNELWHVEFPDIPTTYKNCSGNDYVVNTVISLSGDNIVLLSNYKDTQIFNLYNTKGEFYNSFEQKINSYILYEPMYSNLTGEHLFMVYDIPEIICGMKNTSSSKITPTFLANTPNNLIDYPNSHVYFFAATYKVNTRVLEGKGTIKINKNSLPSGGEVEFIIEPDPGYVLGVVRVIDAEGNIIEFTSNRFTMPSADVTIEAIFVLASTNPNTGDIALIAISAILMISTIILMLNYKKIKFLD